MVVLLVQCAVLALYIVVSTLFLICNHNSLKSHSAFENHVLFSFTLNSITLSNSDHNNQYKMFFFFSRPTTPSPFSRPTFSTPSLPKTDPVLPCTHLGQIRSLPT